jgi:hypothetical protein
MCDSLWWKRAKAGVKSMRNSWLLQQKLLKNKA